ncbi:hypothetical protein EV426DRAFT_578902 [Tirmania nivea]|nr:hypothetical protein EV426DRAFT_578902 [Tirmania nivea]
MTDSEPYSFPFLRQSLDQLRCRRRANFQNFTSSDQSLYLAHEEHLRVERRIAKLALSYYWEYEYEDNNIIFSFPPTTDPLRTLDALIDPPKYLPEDSEYGYLKDLVYLRRWIARKEEELVRRWITNESLRAKMEVRKGAEEWKEERERLKAGIEKGYEFWMMRIPLMTPSPGLDRWSFQRVDWLDVHEDKGALPWGATRTSGYLGNQDSDITGEVFLTDSPANDALMVQVPKTDGTPKRCGASSLTSSQCMAFIARVEEAYGSKGSSGYTGSVKSNSSTSGTKDAADTKAPNSWKKNKKRQNKGKGRGKQSFAGAASAASPESAASLASLASPASTGSPISATSTVSAASVGSAPHAPPPPFSVCHRPTTPPSPPVFTPHPGTDTHGRPDEKYRQCRGNHPPTIACTSCYTKTHIQQLDALGIWTTREFGKNPWEFIGFSETAPRLGRIRGVGIELPVVHNGNHWQVYTHWDDCPLGID